MPDGVQGRWSARIDRPTGLDDGGARIVVDHARSWPYRENVAAPDHLRGDGLLLRRWTRGDDGPFAQLNADPEVMRHFPATKDRKESLAEARTLDRRFETDGFGPWAVEIAQEGFVGFVGAARLTRPMPFAGGERVGATVEIGWRLARAVWGRGIATKAARLALADLFGRCGILSVVAFTAVVNDSSQRVMQRLGMVRAEDFPHPALPAGDRLQPHALYRLSAADFFSGREPRAQDLSA